MQFYQFGEDSQEQTELQESPSGISLKLMPCRFIAHLNQKSPLCYSQIDDENLPLKTIQQPQMRSLDLKSIQTEPPLGKASSSDENNLHRRPSQNADPENALPTAKPKRRKRITIEKKLSEHAALEGAGVVKLKDGKVVFGTWKEGETVGEVKIVYPSGNLYTGETRNYVRWGKGVFCYKNGYKYEGDFVNGKFQGFGVMTNEFGEVVSKGVWGNGELIQSVI